MSDHPPLPIVRTFLVCREIFRDDSTGEYIILGPTAGFNVPQFPARISLSIYGHLTEVRGEVFPEFRVEDADGEITWSYRIPEPIPHESPLQQHRIRFRSTIDFPRPGLYDLLLLVHRREIARYPLRLELREPPQG
jgi:hypothetical protein